MKKINFKKIASVVGVSLLALGAFTACGNKEKTTIIMGTNAAFPPFEQVEGTEIVGFDVDVAKVIAEKLELELVIEDMEFNSLINAVNSGKIDFIAAGMTINAERSAQVDFSTPYFKSKQVIIVSEGSDIKDAEDLEGKKIGVQLGTTGDLFATDEGLDPVQFDKGAMAVMELANGKIDAVILDEEPAKLIAANQTGVVIVEAPFIDEQYGIAVKKGNKDLLEKINAILAQMQADGTYDAIYNKYFEQVE